MSNPYTISIRDWNIFMFACMFVCYKPGILLTQESLRVESKAFSCLLGNRLFSLELFRNFAVLGSVS